MGPIRFFVVAGLGLLSLVEPCSAGLIYSISATDRVELSTQVRITYTVTARADAAVQNVGEFIFRFNAGALPTASNIDSVVNPTIAPASSPWANTNFGTRNASIDPSNRVTFSAFNGAIVLPPIFTPIDTTGGVVGTFDIIWNRPLAGTYDAAFTTSAMTGSYSLAVGGGFDFSATPETPLGVSTIVAVPEPGSTLLMAIASSGVFCLHRRCKRKPDARSDNSPAQSLSA